MKPKAVILRGTGTNCDIETFNSFKYVGAEPELVHINQLLAGEKKVLDYDLMAFPGGFSYGDDISAGKIYAVKMAALAADFVAFIKDRRPVIGICNGFQILVKTGFLPENRANAQTSTLYTNDCGHFMAKWIKLKVNRHSPCIFTKGLPEEIELPIANGEGKFIVEDKKVLASITGRNLHALTYAENPNGSMLDIAGITNAAGTCFGLMPHPERNFFAWQHPDRPAVARETEAVGCQFFKNAVEYVR
ncbi:MAG TPA: phosphoribosylformylglycinamidine synthase subunit PurQ [Elusimicrobiales bacterium]|nr:phosphoribosylformylglycinamidine synthase subunit PurQ [Elusimicrobiales bacterium]